MNLDSRLFVVLTLVLFSGTTAGCESRVDDAIETVREWTKTAELPDEAKNIRTEVEGNAFTREITVRFEAPPSAIEAWLEESPGIADVDRRDEGTSDYSVDNPEVSSAEVTVDWDSNLVTLHGYWS